uniref:Uncharacterized protein n=1 Tax=Arundo donax TaxID=35708 RepID=A0A0A9F9R2_ARUDO
MPMVMLRSRSFQTLVFLPQLTFITYSFAS